MVHTDSPIICTWSVPTPLMDVEQDNYASMCLMLTFLAFAEVFFSRGAMMNVPEYK